MLRRPETCESVDRTHVEFILDLIPTFVRHPRFVVRNSLSQASPPLVRICFFNVFIEQLRTSRDFSWKKMIITLVSFTENVHYFHGVCSTNINFITKLRNRGNSTTNSAWSHLMTTRLVARGSWAYRGCSGISRLQEDSAKSKSKCTALLPITATS